MFWGITSILGPNRDSCINEAPDETRLETTDEYDLMTLQHIYCMFLWQRGKSQENHSILFIYLFYF